MYKVALVFLLFFFSVSCVVAQEQMMPLPEFSVQKAGNGKVRIGWVNPYGSDLIQINVQRSYDSLRGYRTIFSTPSPELPANGFLDNYVEGSKVYYRIFYMLSSNAYFFTKVKKIAPGYVDSSLNTEINSSDSVTVSLQDSVIATLPYNLFLKFRDSIYTNTKDSLLPAGQNLVAIHPYIPKAGEWRASQYIFTDRTGALNLRLPAAREKKYALQVYEADGKTQLFFLKHITEPDLTINKANFIHAGWFVFDLYEDGKLKERNKFYIQKEF
ncbi:hypothetical protein FC093_19570 [Ilyomonas limi]|uniref:DUF4198 domain-containing protein n=1 Tax=Ilyomonas limi TaxID=2575867 RepID=A0A4U3KSZ8_9BACT|nr:hypothetical protein [Ilyomonas limi]TKK65518.1 hypothetical protein FC093_19570 [Ilyomonas limi]